MANRKRPAMMAKPPASVTSGSQVMPGTFSILMTDLPTQIGGEWVTIGIQSHVGLGWVDILDTTGEVIASFKGIGRPVGEQQASFNLRLTELLSESETSELWGLARGTYGAILGLAAAGQLKGLKAEQDAAAQEAAERGSGGGVMGAEGPVEIAGLRLEFKVEEGWVEVNDAVSGAWVGNAFALTRAEGPLFNPSFAYREHLGENAADPHGSDLRTQIADVARARHAQS